MISKENLQTYYEVTRTLIRDINYAYLLPHPTLRNLISNYTITFPAKGVMSEEYTILPHGCATLVLSYDGNKTTSSLFGPMTKPVCVGSEANLSKLLFIVEFQPAGYYAFSGIPQKELTNCNCSFEHINPPLHNLFVQNLENATDICSLVNGIDQLFLAYLKTSIYRPEFTGANHIILESGGQVSVKELSHNLYYSERHLGRIFDQYLGISVKSFSRLVRINKAMRLLKHPNHSVTQVYLTAGFYDMPHFIHEFKSICEITPQKYRDKMSDFYSEVAKF